MRRAVRMGGRRFIRMAAVAASASAVLLATTSAAQASWSSVITMTAYKWEGEAPPTVAVDRYGAAILAWAALNENDTSCYHQIQLRIRSSSGTLGSIKTLTPCGPEMDWPRAAIDDGGAGIVAWVRNDDNAVEARRVSPTGTLGSLLTLTPKGDVAATVAIAMSPKGEALAVWVGQQDGGTTDVQARYISASGALGPVLTLGNSQFGTPSVVIGRNGVATVAWADDNFTRVVARRLTPGSVSALRVIMPAATNTTYAVPPIADDANGDTVFAIGRTVHTSTSQPTDLAERKWRYDGTLGSAEWIAKNVDDLDSTVAVATDGTGDSIVAWSRYVTSTQSDVFGRRVSHAGTLGSVVTLGVGFVPTLTIDPAGAGLATWQSTPLPMPGSTGYGQTQIYKRPFAAGTGTFGSKLTLTSDGDIVRLGESWTGKIAAIWQQSSSPWPIRARFGP